MPTRTGRKSKLTPALATAIVTRVEEGLSLTQAATLAGVGSSTVSEWITRGMGAHPTRARTASYAAFADAVKSAEARDEMARLERLNTAAKGGVRIPRESCHRFHGKVATLGA